MGVVEPSLELLKQAIVLATKALVLGPQPLVALSQSLSLGLRHLVFARSTGRARQTLFGKLEGHLDTSMLVESLSRVANPRPLLNRISK